MHLHIDDLVVSSRTAPLSESAEYIRIWRGIYLSPACIPVDAPPWQVCRIITEARALALTLLSAPDNPPVLTCEAALALRGIDTWWNTTDIMFRRLNHPTKRSIRSFPAMTVKGVAIPAAKIIEISDLPQASGRSVVGGVLVESLEVTAADCAVYLHPLAATVAVSGILQVLSRFDRREIDRSRAQEVQARRGIAAHLESISRQHGYARAMAVIAIADAGVESPGEAVLVWATHCVLHHHDSLRLVTQQPVRVAGQVFFGDLGLPDCHVIMEFDGYAKVSGQGQEARFISRQRKILSAGWKVIRVELKQLLNLDAFFQQFTAELREAGVPATSPGGRLWRSCPPDLMSLKRRG